MRIRHLAAIAAAATLSASALSVVGHASSGGTGAACGASGGGSNDINGALGGQNQLGNSLGLLDQLIVPLLGNAAGGSATSGSAGSSIGTSNGSTTGGGAGNISCGSHLSGAQRKAMGTGTTASSHHRTSTRHSRRG